MYSSAFCVETLSVICADVLSYARLKHNLNQLLIKWVMVILGGKYWIHIQ